MKRNSHNIKIIYLQIEYFSGETILSPLVMCGPHGLKFNVPVELRLPHCASITPDKWNFALKSRDDGKNTSKSQNKVIKS